MTQYKNSPVEYQNTQTSYGDFIIWTRTAKDGDGDSYLITELCTYQGGFLGREDIDLSGTETTGYPTREDAVAAGEKIGKDFIDAKQGSS
jgi:hypothetical protein